MSKLTDEENERLFRALYLFNIEATIEGGETQAKEGPFATIQGERCYNEYLMAKKAMFTEFLKREDKGEIITGLVVKSLKLHEDVMKILVKQNEKTQ